VIDGISVCIPTYNHLRYLQKCLYSITKHSILPKTDFSIFVDGSTDGTIEWLTQEYTLSLAYRHQNKGAYSAWNSAVMYAKNEYVYVAEDDLFFGPSWDLKVAKWIEELGPNYVVMPQLVEPIVGGSYPPPLDCGNTVDNFDEEKFVKYCLENSNRHEAIADPCGFWVLPKDLFFSVGGFDVAYDPVTVGSIDYQLMLSRAHPELRFVRVWDSMIYHFPPSPDRLAWWRREEQGSWHYKAHMRNVQYFENKWKINIEQGYRSIPVGIK